MVISHPNTPAVTLSYPWVLSQTVICVEINQKNLWTCLGIDLTSYKIISYKLTALLKNEVREKVTWKVKECSRRVQNGQAKNLHKKTNTFTIIAINFVQEQFKIQYYRLTSEELLSTD